MKYVATCHLNPADGITEAQECSLKELLLGTAHHWLMKESIEDFIGAHPPGTYMVFEWSDTSSLKLLHKQIRRREAGVWPALFVLHSDPSPFYLKEMGSQMWNPLWGMDLPLNSNESFFIVFR